MTKKNKLIVGGVAVALLAYYLYDRSRKMKVVSDLKNGANLVVTEPIAETSVDVKSIVKPVLKEDTQLNFYGSK